MFKITDLDREALVSLDPKDVTWMLSAEEVVHIAKKLGAYWAYDLVALRQGRPGFHAELKSGRHSNGFFVSMILLEHPNMLVLFADQLARKFVELRTRKPSLMAGIPDGATTLGKAVAEILGIGIANLKKIDGQMRLMDEVNCGQEMILVEDFCTRGTGFEEAVIEVTSRFPYATVFPYELVILNRGGLDMISVPSRGDFSVLALVNHRVDDYEPTDCPLCRAGSLPLKPKASDENWLLLTTYQEPIIRSLPVLDR